MGRDEGITRGFEIDEWIQLSVFYVKSCLLLRLLPRNRRLLCFFQTGSSIAAASLDYLLLVVKGETTTAALPWGGGRGRWGYR